LGAKSSAKGEQKEAQLRKKEAQIGRKEAELRSVVLRDIKCRERLKARQRF